MFDEDIDFILNDRYPPSWSPDEARRIKELFCQLRPVVPATIVKALWQYWYATNREQPLFEDPGDNVALLLHARAYGEQVPSTEDDNFLGKLLKEHRALFAAPALPLLKWGPRAILSQNALAGLTSPIFHVWVFTKEAAVQQILIIGQGLPEIRQQVLANVFTTSLRVHAVANDIMNIGVLRVEFPGYSQTPLDIPFNVLGDSPALLSPDAKTTALEAIQELHSFLLTLAERTGLVQIHEVKTTDQMALTNTYKTYAKQAAVEDKAFLYRKKRQGDESDLVTLVPYWQIARSPLVLALSLSTDLLKTDSYGQLFEAYQAATFHRVMMDIGIRREHYRHEAERLETEKKSFDEATPRERDEIWGKTVLLVQEFKYELGITIKLAQPKEIPTEIFFKNNVPSLIKHYRDWEKRMENILRSLVKSKERPDAPVYRFAACRFLDAALRDQRPDESQAALAAFETWCAQVQPLLWFEWCNHLEQLGIDKKHIFTPHTIFHSTFSLTEDEMDTAEVMISPYTLVDQYRSVGLFDPELGAMAVHDETDYALPFSPTPQSVEEHWNHLVNLANQPDDTGKAFADALRESLRQAPSAMMKRILEELFESHQVGEMLSDKKVKPDEEMLKTLAMAMKKTAINRGIKHANIGMSVMAFQTARRALSQLLEYHPEWAVRIWLTRAIVECLANRLPFQEILPAIYHGAGWSAHSDIRTSIEQADAADHQYVEKWIEAVETNPAVAIGRLSRGLPQAEQELQLSEYAALLARGAIESARLARELEQATASLAEEHEVTTTAFAKLGWALEEALLADLVGGLEGDLIELVKDLTTEEPLKYPGIGGASS